MEARAADAVPRVRQARATLSAHVAHFRAGSSLYTPSPSSTSGTWAPARTRCFGCATDGACSRRWAWPCNSPSAVRSPLADLSAAVMRVDLASFSLLIQCFRVVLASHLQGEFKVEMQAAWEKFLTSVAVVLTEKYR